MSTKAIGTNASCQNASKQKDNQFIVAGRGDAKLCFRLSEVLETGRTIGVSPLNGPTKAYIGSMVLHGAPVPVIDVAFAIGAVPELSMSPPMFVATRTNEVVCIAVDEIVGIFKSIDVTSLERPHELVFGFVMVEGQSLPLIDVLAVSKLTQATIKTSHNCFVNTQSDLEQRS